MVYRPRMGRMGMFTQDRAAPSMAQEPPILPSSEAPARGLMDYQSRRPVMDELTGPSRPEIPIEPVNPEPEERIILPEDQERDFQKWWGPIAEREGYNPDPDLKDHYYDYRKAWLDGVRGPGEDGHWPSDYKDYDHPNVVVGGFHTQTLERVDVIPGITVEDLVREGWGIDTAERFGVEYGLPRGRLLPRGGSSGRLGAPD